MKRFNPFASLLGLVLGLSLIASLFAAPTVAFAADKGVQVATVTATAAGLTQVIPAVNVTGDTGRFTPEWLVLNGALNTQSVYYVSGLVTNLLTVYTNSAAVKIKSIANLSPPLFKGDYILVTKGDGSVSNETVKLIGTLDD
jgi:hypothetical protein